MIQPHDTGGWLIKDPVSLQYTLLSSLEYQVFQRLDGFSDLKTVFTAGSGNHLTPKDLESFLSHLIKRQLLFRPAGGDAARFSLLKPKAASPFAWLTRLLSWYVPLGNPRSLLSKLQWINKVVFRRAFLNLSVMLLAIGMLLLILKTDRLVTEVGQLATSFTAASVGSVLIILVVVKLAHELGHALSARHYGADCHEAGILFLFLTPVPFTNVTDSWRLPVAERMIVTAAGIIVELWIACSCIILWSMAADGLTRDLLLQTALVCSVNTLLFNGNPLLKFDGYFLLSDYLRIPNLSPRSTELLRSLCASFLSGRPIHVSHEKENCRALITYGVLACAYRIFLAFTILEAIHYVSSSNDLRALGWLLKLLTITVLIGLPMGKLLLALVAAPSDDSADGAADGSDDAIANGPSQTWKKGFSRTAFLVIAFVAICCIPLPSRVIGVATITPSQQRIFAGISGRLSVDSIPEGDPITPQSWRLIRTESRLALLNFQSEMQLARLQLQIAQRTQRTDTGPSIQELQEAVESAENRLADFQQTVSQQVQPVSEQYEDFISVRKFRQASDGSFNEEWTGLPLSQKNLGAWIPQGTTLGYRESEQATVVTVWVPQSDIQKIAAGQSASFRLEAGDAESQEAIVKEISRFPTENLPINVAISGNLRGEPTDVGFRPDDTFYAVTIQLLASESAGHLPLHGVGLASVRVKNRSLANRFYDYLRRTFLFSPAS